jgi:pyruvate,water dikinase
LFAFSLPGGLPSGSRTVWSRLPLQPLVAGPLTPFSYSVLAEVAGRAWYQYYDELGFAPTPGARVMRQIEGYPFLNLTTSAQREAEVGAIEPFSLLLDGVRFPIAHFEKPGFLSAIRSGRQAKKIPTLLQRYAAELPAVTQKAAAWATKTQDLHWTQADILQVMEEIVRVSAPSFKIFFAARHNLEWQYNRLLWLTQERQPYPSNLALINSSFCDLSGLHEYKLGEELLRLGAQAIADPVVVAWLQRATADGWQTALPHQLAEAVTQFLATYGHRTTAEAEIRQPRWQQAPQLLFAAMKAYTQKHPKRPAHLPPTPALQQLLEAVDGNAQKEAQQLITQIRRLLQLQSDALHAYAYILTGTRRWALAAANEALADSRLQEADDVFFFEIEEVKQMMTGEWNVSARLTIQQTCAERRAAYRIWQQQAMPWIRIGDAPAVIAHSQGVPGVSGQATGALRRWTEPAPCNCNGAIVGTTQLDSSWSFVLPFARAILAAESTPLDPVVVAARAWHIPTVVGLGARYATLIEGAQTTIHGDSGVVDQ